MAEATIASDFGPRMLSRYDWHGGIDFNNTTGGDTDMGDILIAIVGGQFEADLLSRFKYINIDGNTQLNGVDYDFSYGHVFRSSTTLPQVHGSCRLVRKLNFPNQYAVVVPIVDAMGNSIGYRALSEVAGDTVIINTGQQRLDTLLVGSNVVAGDFIGPVGNSITGGSVAAHLHLYAYNGNNFSSQDGDPVHPLQYLSQGVYPSPNYDVKVISGAIHGVSNLIEEVNLDYSDGESHVIIRPIMQGEQTGGSYTSYIYDVCEVNFQIRENVTGATYSNIKGSEEEGLINTGGIQGDQVYPMRMIGAPNANGNMAQNNTHRGSQSQTGIWPHAYRSSTGGYPYDDFYFANFMPRIATSDTYLDGLDNFANAPDDSRYTDGKYLFKGKIKNSRGVTTSSNDIDFAIDNFKPYIKSIQAFIGDIKIYDFEWRTVNGKLEPSGGIVQGAIPFGRSFLNDGMRVEVEASEQLKSLGLKLHRYVRPPCDPETPRTVPGVATMQNNRKNWTFNFTRLGMCGFGEVDVTGTDWRFRFNGRDFGPDGTTGSKLIDFRDAYDVITDRSTGTTPQFALDHRISTTAGSEWSGTQDSQLASGVDDTHYFRFACSSPGNFRDPNDGNIAVENKLMEDEFLRFICCEEELNIILDPLFQPFDNEDCGPVGSCEMALVVAIEGQEGVGLEGTTPTFTWSNGDTGKYISGLCSGTYTVTATTERGCTAEASFELCCLDLEVLSITESLPNENTGEIRYRVSTDSESIVYLEGEPIPYIPNDINEVNFLGEGEYELKVVSSTGCTIIRNVSVKFCDTSYDTLRPIPSELRCPKILHLDFQYIYSENTKYEWNNGETSHYTNDYCPGVNYSVTITDPDLPCPVYKVIEPCDLNFGLHEDPNPNNFYTSQHHEYVYIPGGSASANVMIDVNIFGGDNVDSLNKTQQINLSPPAGVSIFETVNIPIDFTHQAGRIMSLSSDELFPGLSIYRIKNNYGCYAQIFYYVIRCLREEDISNVEISTSGTIESSGGASIDVLITPSENVPVTNRNYSELTVSLYDEFDRFISVEEVEFFPEIPISVSFTPPYPSVYRVVVEDKCGTAWKSNLSEEIIGCFPGHVKLKVEDACNENVLNYARPWFEVVSFKAHKGSMYEVDEEVTVTINYMYVDEFNVEQNETWYTGKQKITEIKEENNDPILNEFVVSGPPYRYRVDRDQRPGVAIVKISTVNGCTYSVRQPFGKRPVSFPFVSRPDNAHVDHFLVKNSGFVGPFWYGYARCETCNEASTLLQNGANESDCFKGKLEGNGLIRFNYKPSTNNLCTGGGTIMIDGKLPTGEEGIIEIPVYPNSASVAFSEGNTCGCILPPEAVGSIEGEPITPVPVYVEFACDLDGTNTGTPDININLDSLCTVYGRTCDGACESVVDGCSIHILCVETGDTLLHNVERLNEDGSELAACYTIVSSGFNDITNDYRYNVVTGWPCLFDPCNYSLYSAQYNLPNIPVWQFEELMRQYEECPNTLTCDGFGPKSLISPLSTTSSPLISKHFNSFEDVNPLISIMPNPIVSPNRSFKLVSRSESITSLQIFTIQGVTIVNREGYRDKEVTYDFQTTTPPGLYVLKVQLANGEVLVEKIIIK